MEWLGSGVVGLPLPRAVTAAVNVTDPTESGGVAASLVSHARYFSEARLEFSLKFFGPESRVMDKRVNLEGKRSELCFKINTRCV